MRTSTFYEAKRSSRSRRHAQAPRTQRTTSSRTSRSSPRRPRATCSRVSGSRSSVRARPLVGRARTTRLPDDDEDGAASLTQARGSSAHSLAPHYCPAGAEDRSRCSTSKSEARPRCWATEDAASTLAVEQLDAGGYYRTVMEPMPPGERRSCCSSSRGESCSTDEPPGCPLEPALTKADRRAASKSSTTEDCSSAIRQRLLGRFLAADRTSTCAASMHGRSRSSSRRRAHRRGVPAQTRAITACFLDILRAPQGVTRTS